MVKDLIKKSLDIGAIKLNIKQPFCWASGYYMPIYNDNRQLISTYEGRMLITEGFKSLIKENYDYIVGTATSGIAPATSLADSLQKPLLYVRSSSKDHGMQNLIEGCSKDSNLEDKKMILIEDAISTGGSSLRALNVLRDRKVDIHTILAIYSYGFEKTKKRFEDEKVNLISLFDYKSMIKVAYETKYISSYEYDSLLNWFEDPFNWGINNGFNKKEV